MSTAGEARSKRRVSHAEAADILATRDPVLAGLIAAGGPIRISRRIASHFAALVEAIVYQQLAGAAARAIHGRLVAALHYSVEPEALLARRRALRRRRRQRAHPLVQAARCGTGPRR